MFMRAVWVTAVALLAPLLLGATSVVETPAGRIAINRPAGPLHGSIIVIPGSFATTTILDDGSTPDNGLNFLMRTRSKFVAAGFAVAVAADPTDLGPAIAALREIARPVVVIGTSNGTIVAADNAVRLRKRGPDALVLTSTVGVPNQHFSHAVDGEQLARLAIPLLFIHAANDICRVSSLSGAREIASHSPAATFLTFTAVQTNDPDPCGPLSAHGFVGTEQPVVDAIVGWIEKRFASPENRS